MTSRVTLRYPEAADAEALFARVDGSRATLAQWLPWVDETQEVADSAAFIADRIQQRQTGIAHTWLIEVDGDLAGICDLHAISRLNRHASIGYWLADAYVGRGILPQALSQLLAIAFDQLAINRVDIISAAANLRSCAVPDRLGFRQEGVLRSYLHIGGRYWDAKIYSLLADEWQEGA